MMKTKKIVDSPQSAVGSKNRVRIFCGLWTAVCGLFLLSTSVFASVSRVEFYRDGTKIGEDTSAPYSFPYDTNLTSTGSHTFSAKAYDSAGNVTTSSINTVNVSNAAGTDSPFVQKYGGTLNDGGVAVTVDANGNIFLAGSFKGTANFGKQDLVSAGGADFVLAKYDRAGNPQWSQSYGSTGDETVNSIALDSSGNIFIAGNFTGNGNFGGTPTFTSKGSYDAFIAKYDTLGQPLWSKAFGSTGIDTFKGVAVDSQGNVAVTGNFVGKDVNFGGTTLTSYLEQGDSVIVAKYSPTGVHLFSKTFRSTNVNYGEGIAIDKNNNILLTGSFYNTIDFDNDLNNTLGDLTTASAQYLDMFVAKFSSTGDFVRAKGYGNIKGERGNAITCDRNADVIVGGIFYKQTFGGLTGSATGTDIYIGKFSGQDLSLMWVRGSKCDTLAGGCYSLWINAVTTDAQNNIFITGYFHGSFAFGDDVSQRLSSYLNSNDVFVAKYSPGSLNVEGTLLSANHYGGSGSDKGTSIAVDGSGHPIVTGSFVGTDANFGSTTLQSVGAWDAFLMKRDG